MIKRIGFFSGFMMAVGSLVACSGDEAPVQEPVAAEAAAQVPDAPGAEKPAGEGTAAAPVAAEKAEAAPAAAGSMVTTTELNVRKGAGMKFPVARVLKKGESVNTQACEKNWCKIGEEEFVSKKYLK